MRIVILILINSIIFIRGFSQKDKELFNVAITRGLVVYETPLKTIYLSKKDFWAYKENIEELKERIDSSIILEIISNSEGLDSSKWTSRELPQVILVANEEHQISKKKIRAISKKGSVSPISDLKHYNNTPIEKRNILAFSRPVFDNSGAYAAIAYNERTGHGAILYHHVQGYWIELGVLVRWKI